MLLLIAIGMAGFIVGLCAARLYCYLLDFILFLLFVPIFTDEKTAKEIETAGRAVEEAESILRGDS